ncbi:hypothetical protein GEMRC1_006486 [Eukaryota sp. GEM-RC1]
MLSKSGTSEQSPSVPIILSSNGNVAPNCICHGLLKDFKTPTRTCECCKIVFHEICVRFHWKSLSKTAFIFICPKCRPNSYFYEYQELLLPQPSGRSVVVNVLSAVPYSRFLNRLHTADSKKSVEDVLKKRNPVAVCDAPDCFSLLSNANSVEGWTVSIPCTIKVSETDYPEFLTSPQPSDHTVHPISRIPDSHGDQQSVHLCTSCANAWKSSELCTICHRKQCHVVLPNLEASQESSRLQCSLCSKFSHVGCILEEEQLNTDDLSDYYVCCECRKQTVTEEDEKNGLRRFATKLFATESNSSSSNAFAEVDKDFVSAYKSVALTKIVSDLESLHLPSDSPPLHRLSIYYVINGRIRDLSPEDQALVVKAILVNSVYQPISKKSSEFLALKSVFNKLELMIDPTVILSDLSSLFSVFKGLLRPQRLPHLSEGSTSVVENLVELVKQFSRFFQPTSDSDKFFADYARFNRQLQSIASSFQLNASDAEQRVLSGKTSLSQARSYSVTLKNSSEKQLTSIDSQIIDLTRHRDTLITQKDSIKTKIAALTRELEDVEAAEYSINLKIKSVSETKNQESIKKTFS